MPNNPYVITPTTAKEYYLPGLTYLTLGPYPNLLGLLGP